MDGFSVGGAGVSGLKLVVRHPVAVLAWGLVFLICYGLPNGLMMVTVVPQMLQMVGHAGTPPTPMDPAFMAMASQMQLLNLLGLLGTLVAQSLVYSAVCRAILEPHNSSFAYLRVSARELWVGLVMAVGFVLFGVAIVVLLLVLAILGGILAVLLHGSSNPGLMGLLAFAAGVLLVGAAVWIAIRLSLAVPMSFAKTQFRLFEAWPATRGRFWPLFGAGLIAVILAWVCEVVVIGIVFAVVFAALGGQWSAVIAKWTQGGPSQLLAHAGPWIVGMIGLASLIVGALSAVLMAPFATAYKDWSPLIESDPAVPL